MSNVFAAYISDLQFVCALACDFLILLSFLFSFLYALALLIASFIPSRHTLAPNAFGLPGLLLVSILLAFSPMGTHVAFTLYVCLNDGLRAVGIHEWFGWAIVAAWTVTVAAGCLRLLFRIRSLWQYVRLVPEARNDPVFFEALEAVRPQCAVTLKSGGPATSVVSSRMLKGVVLVPEGFQKRYTANERFLIYAHELTHIKYYDAWKHWLAELCGIVFWFNPVVAHAVKRYLSHLEIACDTHVLKLNNTDPHAYATLISKTLSARSLLLPGFSSTYKDLARRLRYIFHDTELLIQCGDRKESTVCILVLSGLFLLSSFWLSDPEFTLTPEPHPLVCPEGMECTTAPNGVVTITTPDGAVLSVTPGFRWQGIIGQYAKTMTEVLRAPK